VDISARDTALIFLLKIEVAFSVYFAEPEKDETGVGDTPVSRYPSAFLSWREAQH